LFLAQLLLEHWAAVVYRHVQLQRGVKRVVTRLRRVIWQSGFSAYLRDTIGLLSDSHPSS
jgi:hypothetical protein